MLKTLIRRGIDYRYDRQHRREATQALRIVEGQTGKTLPRRARRQAEEYAAEVLGSRVFAPWLFLYSAIAGEFREGWIPDNFYGRIVCPNINRNFRIFSGVKTMTRRLFPSDRIPDVAYLIEGRYYDQHLHDINIDDVKHMVFADSDEVVVKIDISAQGSGVQFISRRDFNPAMLAASTPRAVIQTRIKQHPIFDTFVPQGAITLRLTTVRELDATFHIRAAYLRIPHGNHEFVRSASSVRVGIDLSSGTLADSGYLTDWRAVTLHPESNAAFSGFSIPGFSDAVRICQDLHTTVPQVGCIGWDIILDETSKTWILEWNANYNDVKFSEAVTGPCFRNLNWERLRPVMYTWLL